jgi:predicted SAM-dependent methyltransferase/tetratricopeptide (TPR) repeat protein
MKFFKVRSKSSRHRALGDQARDEKRWSDAANHYKLYITMCPGNAEILVQYGHALKEMGRLGEAEQAYKRAIEIRPEEADTYVQLGHVYKLTSRLDAAIEAYSEALKRDSTLESALVELRPYRERMDVTTPEGIQPPAAKQAMDHRQEALIRHVTSLLEQLSTIKAVSFGVARANGDIKRMDKQHHEIRELIAVLDGRVTEQLGQAKEKAYAQTEAIERSITDQIKQSEAETRSKMSAIEGRVVELLERYNPEVRALATRLRQLTDQGAKGENRLNASFADVDARFNEGNRRLEVSRQEIEAVSSRLDQLSSYVHEISSVMRTSGEASRALKALHERVESLEQRVHQPSSPQIPTEVGQMLDYLVGRIEFVRREVMYEFQHGAKCVDAVQNATEIQPTIKNEIKVEAARKAGIQLNLGCGHIMLDGYLNVDRRDLPGVDILAEADSLPFGPNEVSAIHSAHLLEHFPQEAMRRRLLPYWFNLMKPGGRLTAVVPDGAAMLAYAGSGDYKFEEFREVLFGAQDYIGDYHYAMYTPDSLTDLLREVGFESVEVLVEGRRNGLCYEFEIAAEKPGNVLRKSEM